LLGAAVAVGAVQACTAGPGREDVAVQRLQTLLCEKALECGCSPLYYDEFGEALECGDWQTNINDFEWSLRAELAFDPGCVERWSSWVDALSCSAPVLPAFADLCPLYHGTLRVGDPCEQGSIVDTDCDRGLFCIAGTCRDPELTAFGGLDEPCELGNRCDGALACIDELCQRLPGAGEPCLDYLCSPEARCDFGYEICVALPGPGEPCDAGECLPGSFCGSDPNTGMSECLRTGDVGDPCMGHRQCTSGNCPAGYCEDPAGVGDPCDGQLPCGPGLFCAEGQCQDGAGGGVTAGSTCSLLDVL
jgi:hypothetical protein